MPSIAPRSTAACLVLFALGCGHAVSRAASRARLDPTQLIALRAPRMGHTATLLNDGRVLVVGGEDLDEREPTADVELVNETTQRSVEGPVLPVARANHIAVKLLDGRVLIAGGGRSAPIGVGAGIDVLRDAYLFDPANSSWEQVGSMATGRSHFGAALLPSGRVIVVGGTSGLHTHGSECTGVASCGPLGDTLDTAEVFDPATRTFVAASALNEGRSLFSIDRLADGRICVAGGMNDRREGFRSVELFDEATGAWTLERPLSGEPRLFHGSVAFADGILVGGGKRPDVHMLDATESWSPLRGATAMGPLPGRRTITVFATYSEQVVGIGGLECTRDGCHVVDDILALNADTRDWHVVGRLRFARGGHTVTGLASGGLLVCGGFGDDEMISSCELIPARSEGS